MNSLTDQLHAVNNNYLGQYNTNSSSMMSQGYRDAINPAQRSGNTMGAGYDKATNGGQSFDRQLTGSGKGNWKMPSASVDTSNHWNPQGESKFMANQWQDIGGGELQNTGMAGSSMNLYIQKMLSNPAIMQLLQQRMSQSQGVSNGS